MINVAVKAARAAGSLINRAALDVESVRVSQKKVNDFVTEVDHAAEKVIIETLLTASRPPQRVQRRDVARIGRPPRAASLNFRTPASTVTLSVPLRSMLLAVYSESSKPSNRKLRGTPTSA